MRNISFDESTVLRELARIAGEKGLVKEAAPPAPAPGPVMPSTKVHAFDEQLLAFPILNSVNKGQKVTDGGAFLKELGSDEFRRFKDGWAKSADPAGKQKVAALVAKAVPFLKQLQAQLKKMSPNHQQAYLPSVETALALLTRASVEDDLVKQSADKLYDVSGEEGKDLIDAAHPGGGTATELTHSKTKENVVETIVEQQEADIEVARKAPKGTYAALVNLYNKLSKLGFEDKLADLKESIIAVATEEEIVEHTLVTLADDLDRLGHAKYADLVDDLLKKKVTPLTAAVVGVINANNISKRAAPMPTADQAKAQFYTWLRNLPPAREEEYMKQRIMEMVNKLQPRDWNQFLSSLLSIGQYAAGSGTNIGTMIGNEISNIQRLYPKARQVGGPEHPAGVAGRKTRMDPKVLQVQKEFNRLFKGKYRPIKEDGVMGPETETAQLIMRRQNRLEGDRPVTSPIEGLENAQKREIKMRPQDAEALILQKFQGRFGRLPLNRVPELVEALKTQARELHAGGYSPDELSKQFDALVNRITSNDVRQYIR